MINVIVSRSDKHCDYMSRSASGVFRNKIFLAFPNSVLSFFADLR